MELFIPTSMAAKKLGCTESNLSQYVYRLRHVVRVIDKKSRRHHGRAMWPSSVIHMASLLREEAAKHGKRMSPARAIELVSGKRPITSGWVPTTDGWVMQSSQPPRHQQADG